EPLPSLPPPAHHAAGYLFASPPRRPSAAELDARLGRPADHGSAVPRRRFGTDRHHQELRLRRRHSAWAVDRHPSLPRRGLAFAHRLRRCAEPAQDLEGPRRGGGCRRAAGGGDPVVPHQSRDDSV
ncbi:hypothetical protein, partial [Pseudomonas sp. FG-3G]